MTRPFFEYNRHSALHVRHAPLSPFTDRITLYSSFLGYSHVTTLSLFIHFFCVSEMYMRQRIFAQGAATIVRVQNKVCVWAQHEEYHAAAEL